MKDFSLDDMVRLVGRRCRVPAEMTRIIVAQQKTNLFAQFPAQRSQGAFAILDLAASLHKPLRPGFPDKQ